MASLWQRERRVIDLWLILVMWVSGFSILPFSVARYLLRAFY